MTSVRRRKPVQDRELDERGNVVPPVCTGVTMREAFAGVTPFTNHESRLTNWASCARPIG